MICEAQGHRTYSLDLDHGLICWCKSHFSTSYLLQTFLHSLPDKHKEQMWAAHGHAEDTHILTSAGRTQRMEWVGIAAAKSRQSCLTLRPHRWQSTRLPRPWDSPGKNIGVGCHFLLQCMKEKVKVKSLSRVQLLATPWTAAHQAPPSMGFSRQEYWSGWPLPSLWVGIRRTHARTSLTHSCLNLATGISASTLPPSQSVLPTARPIFPKSFSQLTLRLSVLISAFWWSIWNCQIMAGLGSKSPNSGPLPHSSEMKARLLVFKTLLPLPPLPFSLSHSACSSNTLPT